MCTLSLAITYGTLSGPSLTGCFWLNREKTSWHVMLNFKIGGGPNKLP